MLKAWFFLSVFGVVDVWQPKLSLGYPFVLANIPMKTGKKSLSVTGSKDRGGCLS